MEEEVVCTGPSLTLVNLKQGIGGHSHYVNNPRPNAISHPPITLARDPGAALEAQSCTLTGPIPPCLKAFSSTSNKWLPSKLLQNYLINHGLRHGG